MKSYKWRLYADNNTEREIVEQLRKSDMDVLWVAEQPELRRQIDDSFHYQKARELNRHLVTHDDDFWNDRNFSLKICPGLILLATQDTEIGKYVVILLRKLVSFELAQLRSNPCVMRLTRNACSPAVRAALNSLAKQSNHCTPAAWNASD